MPKQGERRLPTYLFNCSQAASPFPWSFWLRLPCAGLLDCEINVLSPLIGVALAIEGVGYLVNSFSLFLAPLLQTRISPFFAATGLADVSLALWLLVMGVNESQWTERARAAGFQQ